MNPFAFLDGYKTYIAAFGLLGLGLYQFSQNDYVHAYQSVMAGLAAFGLRGAVSKLHAKVDAATAPVEEVK